MNNFLDFVLLGNSMKDWLIATGIIVLSFLAIMIIRKVIIMRLKKFSAKTNTSIDDLVVDLLNASVIPLLYVVAVYYGIQYLKLDVRISRVLHVAMLVAAAFFIIRMITSFITYVFNKAVARHGNEGTRKKQAGGILLIINVVVWLCGLLFLIDNLGYDITTLVAGLGIGGIAIALAAQTILGDLFSYMVIFFDKPFETGDFIIMDDKMGTVEYIGIKTTRIRTLGGEQLICSNTDLTNSRVHNYKRMEQRRIVFTLGVVYSTTPEQLKQIPSIIETIIGSVKGAKLDRAHFKSFGAYSLDFEVVYFVLTADYNIYMDIQQEINLQIFTRFEQEGIEFAFPTQTLMWQQEVSAGNTLA